MLMFVLFFFALSFNLHADSLHRGAIHYIDEGRTPEEPTHLYMSDGFVLKINNLESKNLVNFEDARKSKLHLEILADDSRNVLSVTTLEAVRTFENPEGQKLSYVPTILASSADANRIFNALRKGSTSWSQCYNRAHIWAYESKEKFNLDSMKVFMFYTRKYIREYNFGWWFHVAPFTYVRDNGVTAEKVLDYKFTRGPHTMKDWTDIFMKNKVNCPVVTRYSDYENNQENQYCYLYKTSMYYLQPLDLENLERTGTIKSQWLNYEVKRAYRNGFGVWP